MKTITTKKSALLLASVFTLALVNAKTYVATFAGKWSDASIWEGAKPTQQIEFGDEVIIKNHVIVTEDLKVNGSLIIDRNSSFTSNRSFAISFGGQLVNNGSINVKRMLNDGKIENYGSLETMAELQNNGNLTNDQNIIAGSSIVNQGGKLDGQDGSYFANDNVISSRNAAYGDHIKIFYGGGAQTATTPKSNDFNVEIVTLDNNVTLTVQNLSNYKVNGYNVLRSFNGTDFVSLTNDQNANNEIVILHDNDVNSSIVHYKVVAQTSYGEIEIPVTSVGLSNSRMSMK